MGGWRDTDFTDFPPHFAGQNHSDQYVGSDGTGRLGKRRHNPENRREILVSITPEAQRLRKEYDAVSQQINEVYYRGFTENEIHQHETYLARILANLEEYETLNGRKTT